MVRLFLLAGATLGMLSVILGAFGAHALRDRLSVELLHSYETAVHYQFMHALVLLLVGLLLQLAPENRLLGYSGYTLLSGTLLFSGSLYLLVLTGIRQLGPFNIGLVTPLGGSILIIGWALLLLAALKF